MSPLARPSLDAVLCDFLAHATADLERGELQPLSSYLARFPGYEVDIAREFLALVALDGSLATPGGVAQDPLERFARPRTAFERYALGDEIGSGGMGVVRAARDLDLDRTLAMKTIRRDGAIARRRFLAEAHVTGKLDHPGVVPVHEVGVDGDGRLFFTMRLVEGLDLEDVIRRLRAHDPEWTLPRALEVLIKVCDTMAFAHSRGVVHRDLKPANVRVGRFGEAYVMDWGLARTLGDAEVETAFDGLAGEDDGAALLTHDGDVLGTPAYMPPEQARGELDGVGPRSDVYALGAMLHQILTGERPYATGAAQRSAAVLELVRAGPPRAVRSIDPSAPPELAAICAKAMERDPARRYESASSMARDLRAYLDGRVVQAHDSGAFMRVRKWIARNRTIALVTGCALAGALVAALVVGYERAVSRSRLISLSGSQLARSFDDMWPPSAQSVPVLERWLDDVKEYVSTRDENLRHLESLRQHALPMNSGRPAELRARGDIVDMSRQRLAFLEHLHDLRDKLDRGVNEMPSGWSRETLEAETALHEREAIADRDRPTPHRTFEFADPDDQRLHDALVRVLDDQTAFVGNEEKISLVRLAEFGLAASRRIDRESLELARASWEAAIASIRDVRECPMYGGLVLKPQLGLVPVGRDPSSGLWEFAHVASGRPAERDADGSLLFYEDTGIVLVLVPGGTLERGSQSADRAKSNFDSWADADAPGGTHVALDPFFVSKHEMTLAQWKRATGSDPNEIRAGEHVHDGRVPVRSITWTDARLVLRVMGLVLPTEAQWEWAARAGTSTPWWCGSDPCEARAAGNLADREAAWFAVVQDVEWLAALDQDDGYDGVAPVGSFAANPYGLYDTIGNVREWCRDRGGRGYDAQVRLFTGERIGIGDGTQAVRGGSFATGAIAARSAHRELRAEGYWSAEVGIRPARAIDW